MKFPPAFFVTGTDTGIGKTFISAILTEGLNASYWKPIQAGLEDETDTEFVQRLSDVPDSQIKSERYRLRTPMSPHGAAAIDGKQISLTDFELPEYNTDHLIVEGAGGLLVPVNDDDMIIDLIAHLNLPVLLVVRSSLGTLNHTFLSLEVLRRRNIPILGVVMNGKKHQSNYDAITKYGKVDILAEVEFNDQNNNISLSQIFHNNF